MSWRRVLDYAFPWAVFLCLERLPYACFGGCGAGRSPESSAIGDLRTVISAEAAYADDNGGQYGPLECLRAPQDCGAARDAPTYLEAHTATPEVRRGYRWRFVAGPPVAAPRSRSIASYVIAAEPADPKQHRAFAGDETGRVCVAEAVPALAPDGTISPACKTLS